MIDVFLAHQGMTDPWILAAGGFLAAAVLVETVARLEGRRDDKGDG